VLSRRFGESVAAVGGPSSRANGGDDVLAAFAAPPERARCRALPCERFTSALADSRCITRGRCGSLLLHRDGLSPSTSCRFPGAPVQSINNGNRCISPTRYYADSSSGLFVSVRSVRLP
jgi:hypothetical protein